MGVDKLYESENYLIVNKPYDMYINSDDENEKNTVTQHIASPDSHLSTSAAPLHFVQRLDYSTSGVLCIAKNKSAAARAGRLFERRLTRKYYLAVVRGRLSCDVADIEFDVGTPLHLSTPAAPLHFVQRLDYSTSGVLCIAKNKSAAARAGRMFERRLTRKYYLAVVWGRLSCDVADIEFDVGVDPLTATSSHRMVAATSSTSTSSCVEARQAHTRLLALESGQYDGDPATVVLLKPVTGRRHQLRVHCSAAGHTILGDYTYSNALDTAPHRMFLHATRLVLPLKNEPVDIQSPEPFFSDPQFASKWKSEKVHHKYRGDDFKAACDTIDADYVLGLKYTMFNRIE